MINLAKNIFYHLKTELSTLPNFFQKNIFLNDDEKDKFIFLKKNNYLNNEKKLNKEMVIKANNLITKNIQENDKSVFIKKHLVHKILYLDNFEFLINEIVDEKMINLISNYFKSKKISISDIDIRRVLPISKNDIEDIDKSNNEWHKDIRGKQLKLMIYLSDVSATDSYFSIIKSSSISRTYNFKKSRIKEKNIDIDKEKKFLANKGAHFLFDTNLIHKLNRSENAKIRDTLTIYFKPGEYSRNFFYDIENIAKLNSNLRNLIKMQHLNIK